MFAEAENPLTVGLLHGPDAADSCEAPASIASVTPPSSPSSARWKVATPESTEEGASSTEDVKTIDELLELTASDDPETTFGFFRFPRAQMRWMILCVLVYTCASVGSMISVFLFPKLEVAWGMSGSTAAMLGSVYFVGNLFGITLFGFVGDRYGRRVSVLLAVGLSAFSAHATFLCPGYLSLGAMRILSGMSAGGCLDQAVILGLELVPPSKRMEACSFFAFFGWSGALTVMTVVAYLVRNMSWHMLVACSLQIIPLLAAVYWYLPESPRFLLSTGDEEKTMAVIRKVAEINGATPLSLDVQLSSTSSTDSDSTASTKEAGILDSIAELASPALRVPTLLCSVGMFAAVSGYFSVALASSGSGLYQQQFLCSLLEGPGYLLSAPLGDTIGRRLTWGFATMIGSAALLSQAVLPPEVLGTLPFYMNVVARVCIGSSTGIAMVAMAEQFPTSCRSNGVAFGAMAGRLGSVIAPVVAEMLDERMRALVIGLMLAVGSICILFLKETLGAVMADQLE